jgi:hypothetical protein
MREARTPISEYAPTLVEMAEPLIITGTPEELKARALAGRVMCDIANNTDGDVRGAYVRAAEMPLEEAQAIAELWPPSPIDAAQMTALERSYLAGRIKLIVPRVRPRSGRASRSTRRTRTRGARAALSRSTDDPDLDPPLRRFFRWLRRRA